MVGMCIYVCVARYYTRADGICELCVGGTYNDKLNATSCANCPAGHYSPIGATSEREGCIQCQGNMVAAQSGSEVCKRCLSNARPGTEYIDCLCEPGFFMDRSFVGQGTADGENKTCNACPRGADCRKDRIIAKV